MYRIPIVQKTAIALCAALAAFFPFSARAADRIPNDPYFADQWHLQKIGAPQAWIRTLGFEGVTVALIDSGVDIDHPDLRENIWRNPGEVGNDGIDNDGNGYVDDIHGWDFTDNDNDPRPSSVGDFSVVGMNHGTIGAGMVAAKGDNGQGIVGVTWQTTVMPLRALDSYGGGESYRVVQAVEYAVKNGAKVIALSFAGSIENDLLKIALRNAYNAGVFVVVAAGNAPDGAEAIDLDRNPLFPVCLDREADENFIFGVAATDDQDRKAQFSNFGAGCVDISAPGTRIISTQLYRPNSADFKNPYGGFYNGTSVATPIVAGVVALIKSVNKNLTNKQIANILISTSDNIDAANPGLFGKIGRGRINAYKAVEAAATTGKDTAPAPTTTSSLLPGGNQRSVIAAPGSGRTPEIRFFTEDGLFIRSFLAFDKGFKGGISLSVGNFDGNARQTIVAGAGPGGAPHVRIFDVNTKLIGTFYAYDQKFRGGISVAAGDIDGNNKDEIVTGAGPGGGPHVRIFRPDGTPMGGFFAYDQKFRSGINVEVSDDDGDGKNEIIVTPISGSVPTRVFNARGQLLREIPLGKKVSKSLVAGSPAGAAPIVTITRPTSAFSFPAFEASFKGGVRVGTIEMRR